MFRAFLIVCGVILAAGWTADGVQNLVQANHIKKQA